MPPSNEQGTTAVPAWLHALWGLPARVSRVPAARGGEAVLARPVLTGRKAGERILHLPAVPPCGHDAWAAAAAAHAAAHWRFGGPPQPRQGLKPIQMALIGVLEDARVELLAAGELPGLRRLWLPFHAAQGEEGAHFAALLGRLSRALLDPQAQDPHPWVTRIQRMLAGRLLAMDPAALRAMASVLGNEVGQMRLAFDAAAYRVHAAYRDDHHFLWEEDSTLPPSPHALEAEAAPGTSTQDGPRSAPTADQARVAVHPEWDHRIARLRPGWVRVQERLAPVAAGPSPADPGLQRRVRAWTAALRAHQPAPRRPAGRAAWGNEFHPDALVDAGVRQRMREPVDERLYSRQESRARDLCAVLLVDTSASTALQAGQGQPLLRTLAAMAQGVGAALEAVGQRCAIAAFRSDGRHRVEFLYLKQWHEPALAPEVGQRLSALRPQGSTRTGAVLRHTAGLLAAARPGRATAKIVLLSDGQPHDIDVHHPAYLVQDLMQAIREARRANVQVICLPLHAIVRAGPSASVARLLAA